MARSKSVPKNHHLLPALSILVLIASTFVLTKVGPQNFRNVLGAQSAYTPNASSSFKVQASPTRFDQLGKVDITASLSNSVFSGPVIVRYFLCRREAISISDSSCRYSDVKWNFAPLIFSNGRVSTDFGELAKSSKYWAAVGKYFMSFQALDSAGKPVGPQSNEVSYTVDPVDMGPYWNLESGLSYLYSGKNYMVKTSTGQPSPSIVQVDLRLSPACGINYYGYTFSKSNPTGYFDPCTRAGVCGDPKQANSGALNTNFYVAWVKNNEAGGEQYLSSNLTNFVDNLGQYISADTKYPSQFSSTLFKSQNYDSPESKTSRIFMRSSDNPNSNIGYNLGPRYLDLLKINEKNPVVVNRQEFYDFAPNWKALSTNQDRINLACNLVNNYKTGTIPTSLAGGNFHTTYVGNFKYEYVSTPAYTGNAMRLTMREVIRCGSYADFTSGKCQNVLREDWYLAKNIGLVKISQNYSNAYRYSGPNCSADSDCTNVDTSIRSPEYEQVLLKYGKI